MTHILTGKGLSKYFMGLAALEDVSFYINENEIFGLIGPNGAGKTTLFNLIAGVFRSDAGEIYFKDHKLNGLRPDERCKLGIARTFQIAKPFLSMNVFENATLAAYFGSSKKIKLQAARVLA